MASLLERTLGGIRKDNAAPDNRRTSGGGGQSRSSPYAVSRAPIWSDEDLRASQAVPASPSDAVDRRRRGPPPRPTSDTQPAPAQRSSASENRC